MARHDGRNRTELEQLPCCGVVDEPDRVPQHVATRPSHQERALPDADLGFRPDTDQAGFDVLKLNATAIVAQVSRRRPRLA